MAKVSVIFEDYVEDALRKEARRKGDISNIVNEAVRIFLKLPRENIKVKTE